MRQLAAPVLQALAMHEARSGGVERAVALLQQCTELEPGNTHAWQVPSWLLASPQAAS